jgi:hypothetical protein
MKGNRNPNTRAIVSALRCDHRSLRVAAIELVDNAIKGDLPPRVALMLAFDSSDRTADTILKARAKVSKTGARKR